MIYLASPYSSIDARVREDRFRAAARHAAMLVKRGEHVFSPVVHSHPIAIYGTDVPTHFAFWREFDRRMLAHCDFLRVLRLDGWDESLGVQQEILIATEYQMPIMYEDPE